MLSNALAMILHSCDTTVSETSKRGYSKLVGSVVLAGCDLTTEIVLYVLVLCKTNFFLSSPTYYCFLIQRTRFFHKNPCNQMLTCLLDGCNSYPSFDLQKMSLSSVCLNFMVLWLFNIISFFFTNVSAFWQSTVISESFIVEMDAQMNDGEFNFFSADIKKHNSE